MKLFMKLYDDYFDLYTGNLIVQPHATVPFQNLLPKFEE